MHNNIPVIVLAGDGGSGKDTIAQELSSHLGLPYKTSTSYVAARKMWDEVNRYEQSVADDMKRYGIDPNHFLDLTEWYNERSNYRQFWADWIERYNKQSASKAQLYTDCVEEGNHILTGLRKPWELEAFLATGIPDIVIWIDRPGTPRDPTQLYGPEKCDLTFRNDGDLLTARMRIHNLVKLLQAYRLM